jgi:hypothetical protein
LGWLALSKGLKGVGLASLLLNTERIQFSKSSAFLLLITLGDGKVQEHVDSDTPSA